MTMSTKKLPTIKAVTGFRKMLAEAVLSIANAIYTAMNGNANFAAPPSPFDLPTLLAANQALSAANAAALDGGKKALAQKSHQKEVVVKILELLAKYVEANCKEDMTIFLSSGFTAVSTTKTAAPPLSEKIRSVDLGPKSGEMTVRLVSYPGAGSYELRWAPVPAGGVPTAWITQPITNVRSSTIISGLTPGTVYAFQARAVVKSAYTDFGDSVTQMAT
jgi:hypothetical protein